MKAQVLQQLVIVRKVLMARDVKMIVISAERTLVSMAVHVMKAQVVQQLVTVQKVLMVINAKMIVTSAKQTLV